MRNSVPVLVLSIALVGCATSRPDPSLAPADLRADLDTALNDICLQTAERSVGELAEAQGWLLGKNRITQAFGPRSYLPDERVWESPSGVVVYNQIIRGRVCTINVFGEQASLAAEVMAELINQRPEGYAQNEAPVMRIGEGYTYHPEERTYTFDAMDEPNTPIGIFVAANEILGLSKATTLSSDRIPR